MLGPGSIIIARSDLSKEREGRRGSQRFSLGNNTKFIRRQEKALVNGLWISRVNIDAEAKQGGYLIMMHNNSYICSSIEMS